MSNKQLRPFTDIENVLPILNGISIFGGLTEQQPYDVFRLLKKISFKAGEKVFQLGQQADHIYIICSGKVKMVVDIDGTNMELVELDSGKCFGETSTIGIQPPPLW